MNALGHLTETIKSAFPDSKIALRINLKRTKETSIAKNVIGETEKYDLGQKLKNTMFSILTDESTDISTTKTRYILVRYYDDVEGRIVSKFWDLSQVFSNDGSVKGASAEHLYQCLVKSFQEQSVPVENIIGFGSDGCNVMMGEHNSVSSRLKRYFPGIFILKCLCHSLHFVVS